MISIYEFFIFYSNVNIMQFYHSPLPFPLHWIRLQLERKSNRLVWHFHERLSGCWFAFLLAVKKIACGLFVCYNIFKNNVESITVFSFGEFWSPSASCRVNLTVFGVLVARGAFPDRSCIGIVDDVDIGVTGCGDLVSACVIGPDCIGGETTLSVLVVETFLVLAFCCGVLTTVFVVFDAVRDRSCIIIFGGFDIGVIGWGDSVWAWLLESDDIGEVPALTLAGVFFDCDRIEVSIVVGVLRWGDLISACLLEPDCIGEVEAVAVVYLGVVCVIISADFVWIGLLDNCSGEVATFTVFGAIFSRWSFPSCIFAFSYLRTRRSFVKKMVLWLVGNQIPSLIAMARLYKFNTLTVAFSGFRTSFFRLVSKAIFSTTCSVGFSSEWSPIFVTAPVCFEYLAPAMQCGSLKQSRYNVWVFSPDFL